MFRKLKMWLLNGLRKRVSSLDDDPTFGFFTTAKPYVSSPDTELSDIVGKMLAGDLIPEKKLVRLELVAHYSDGFAQYLFSSTEPVHVVSTRTPNGVHYDFTLRTIGRKG